MPLDAAAVAIACCMGNVMPADAGDAVFFSPRSMESR